MNACCWLCRYNQTEDAKLMQTFITENAGSMSPAQMAAEITRDLQDRHPDAEGICHETCLQHIEGHSLNPTLRISGMLRSLLKLSDELQLNLRRFDEDGNSTLDPKLVETYLKVQQQIMAVYKQTDVNRLLFSGS